MNHVVVGRGGGRNTLSVEREREGNGLIAKCVACTEFSVNNLRLLIQHNRYSRTSDKT